VEGEEKEGCPDNSNSNTKANKKHLYTNLLDSLLDWLIIGLKGASGERLNHFRNR